MDILNQKIKIRVNNFNMNHFKLLGYITKPNEYIEIYVKELPIGSGTKINVVCNYCGDVFKKPYRRYLETQKDICCKNCKNKKMVKNSILKYGYACSLKNDIVQEKSRLKNRDNLGVDYPFQNKDVLKKCKETSAKKYNKKCFSNKVSKPQIKIHDAVGGIMNKAEFPYLLDIFFKKDKIYLEYDGSGHTLSIKFGRVSENEFYEKENKRKQYLKELGYKEFRLVSTTDAIPDKKELLKIKKRAFKFLKSGYNSYIYNLDTKTESFSE